MSEGLDYRGGLVARWRVPNRRPSDWGELNEYVAAPAAATAPPRWCGRTRFERCAGRCGFVGCVRRDGFGRFPAERGKPLALGPRLRCFALELGFALAMGFGR